MAGWQGGRVAWPRDIYGPFRAAKACVGPVWSRCWWRKGGGGAWRHEIEAACEVERGWRVRGRGRGEGKDTVQRRDALGPLATSADQLELTNRVLVEEFLHPFVKHLAHILLVSFILKKIAIC